MSFIRTNAPNLEPHSCPAAPWSSLFPWTNLPWASLLWASLLAGGCSPQNPPKSQPPAEPQAASPAEPDAANTVDTTPPPVDDYADGPILAMLEPHRQADVRGRLQALFGQFSTPRLTADSDAQAAQRVAAAENFGRRCAPCHGPAGAGDGARSDQFEPRPRDFRRGLFKFTSTRFDAKATRDDLILTLRQGLPGTGMPSFVETPPDELAQLVEHVILLAMRGEVESILANEADGADEPLPDDVVAAAAAEVAARWDEAPQSVIDPPPAPPADDDAIERGRKLFQSEVYRCYVCHAIDGRGMPDFETHPIEDSWGRRTKAFDLAAANLRRGAADVELYRRTANGIPGSGMPSYESLIADRPGDAWDLVRYVQQIAAEAR